MTVLGQQAQCTDRAVEIPVVTQRTSSYSAQIPQVQCVDRIAAVPVSMDFLFPTSSTQVQN